MTTADINGALFGVRCQAMAYALSTATPGEPHQDIMARATTYADFMSDPLLNKVKSDEMGPVLTETVQ